jgi:hypothetical protein
VQAGFAQIRVDEQYPFPAPANDWARLAAIMDLPSPGSVLVMAMHRAFAFGSGQLYGDLAVRMASDMSDRGSLEEHALHRVSGLVRQREHAQDGNVNRP